MKSKLIIYLLLLGSFLSLSAQEIQVKGTVVSAEDGFPIPGASINVSGTTTGTITDIDGNFEIKASVGQKLSIKYIGFASQEIIVTAAKKYAIVLKTNINNLDEVVVVGYSSQKKTDITGAVTIVDMEELNKQVEANPIKSLQGRVAGVQITTDGSPSGGNTAILIRGNSNIGGNSTPLFVIDGVPTKSGMHELNPNDIATIQVLKDAASASIYGSRASNGVIIITTKQGKSGKMKIDFSSFLTASTYANRLDVLNAKEYGEVLWQANINDGLNPNNNNLSYQFDWSRDSNNKAVLNYITVPEFLDSKQTLKSADTDWYKEIAQTGIAKSYDLSVSNGSEKGNYLFSLGYYNNDGIVKNSNFERITARLNTSFKYFDNKLIIGENLSINKTGELQIPGVLDSALKASPLIPVRTVDGIGWGGPVGGMNDRQNPVRLLDANKYNGYDYHRLFGNVFASLEIVKNLNLKTNYGLEYNDFYKKTLQFSYQSGYLKNDKSAVNIDNSRSTKFTWTNTLNYKLNIKKHNLEAFIGSEMFKESNKNTSLRAEDFVIETPDFMYPDAASGKKTNFGSATAYSLLSYFGNINYDYDGRYLLSATLRHDGSSRFGKNNKFGTFPALSAGWRISNEKFISDNFSKISDLKLRVGWGKTGNQEIGNSDTYSLYVSDYAGGDPTWNTSYGTAYDISGQGSGTLPSGYRATQIGNDNLKWETTTQTNVGLDFGFFRSKLFGSLDYYIKQTEDILIRPPYIAVIGEGGGRTVNGANMENKGWEFSIGYRNETAGGFTYEVNGNISSNKNKITNLPEVVKNSYGGNGSDDNILGRSIGSMYGYVSDGLFTSNEQILNSAEQPGKDLGRIRYRDLDGNGIINDADRTWIGVPHPDFAFGINVNLEYKDFDFTMFWQGVGKVDVVNQVKYQTDFWSVDDIGSNKGSRLLNAWSPSNPNSTIPALTTIDKNAESRFSTYYIENGSYVKLRNMQVGYSLPKDVLDRLSINKFRFYLGVQNLLTIKSSSFTGVDPENAGFGYPLPLTSTLGFNISF
ncbi:SusC/RagA family TonB-linked outer membrane protein [Flavobacterium cellulosilyticum]|uniref:TonB-dependent receptor n=1 Tax=Flavobacterium cellulosilyticum TaxID=2541731 RepID=A0A4R5CGW4_9FLAO|nr:TonB-dependent receptor [Flavobacterium cellulosilyticum]TDD99361.1 TonB-dependent receptor [Flavobacterium cellulosilyticum]